MNLKISRHFSFCSYFVCLKCLVFGITHTGGLSEGGNVMSNSDQMLDDGGLESQKFWQLIISWTYMDAVLLHVPSFIWRGGI